MSQAPTPSETPITAKLKGRFDYEPGDALRGDASICLFASHEKLEHDRARLMEALRELHTSRREYERLMGTSVGDEVDDARERFNAADMDTELFLKELT